MTSKADYWTARKEDLLLQMEQDESVLREKLGRIYENQATELEREIASYYQRYGENNVIEYRKLLVSLSDQDRKLLIERCEEFAEKYPQYAHLLPVRKSIYKLNELEGIQASIRLRQLEIAAIEEEELRTHFEKYDQRAANLAMEQLGFGEQFYPLNSGVIAETVNRAWANGSSFSKTIWDNREKLAGYLNDDFAQLLARGVAYDVMTRSLRERFENVSFRNAKRLIYTEGTFLFNEAQAQAHEGEFEYYALSCADSRACQVCKDIQAAQQKTPAKFSERAPGINFPPLHPWCRCSYTVEVADWDRWIDDYVAKHGGSELSNAAKSLIEQAQGQEPSVTEFLKSFEGNGISLQGLDFRLKSYESLRRKIKTETLQSGSTVNETAGTMKDILRYTYTLPNESFCEDFTHIKIRLEQMGYNFTRVKNTLKSRDAPYRGVNTNVTTPDGYLFELQFHTAESLELKEINHKLYEEARVLGDSAEDKARAAELNRRMIVNANSIPTPRGIEGVK